MEKMLRNIYEMYVCMYEYRYSGFSKKYKPEQ